MYGTLSSVLEALLVDNFNKSCPWKFLRLHDFQAISEKSEHFPGSLQLQIDFVFSDCHFYTGFSKRHEMKKNRVNPPAGYCTLLVRAKLLDTVLLHP